MAIISRYTLFGAIWRQTCWNAASVWRGGRGRVGRSVGHGDLGCWYGQSERAYDRRPHFQELRTTQPAPLLGGWSGLRRARRGLGNEWM